MTVDREKAMSEQAKLSKIAIRVIEGSIWERDDELFMVEKVYGAKRPRRAEDGSLGRDLEDVTLVKSVRITNMPGHIDIEKWLAGWHPYDPEEEIVTDEMVERARDAAQDRGAQLGRLRTQPDAYALGEIGVAALEAALSSAGGKPPDDDPSGVLQEREWLKELERLRVENAYLKDTSPSLAAENVRVQERFGRLEAVAREVLEAYDKSEEWELALDRLASVLAEGER